MSKAIVVYYSYEGSTEEIAEALSDYLKIDLLEIKPINEKKATGFSKFFWGGSQVVMGKTPELSKMDKNIDDYDTIIIGSPTWAGSYTPPVKTLFDKGFVKDKKVAYFYSHLGGDSKVESKVRALIEKNNQLIGIKAIKDVATSKDQALKDIKNWADSLAL
ncbi:MULTISPECIES: flavodoxin [unclassified Fusibacter]|uniref:flavodoxin family protein n=1 Tax=unclassified Fusibacter TaxID=2624464 RepID=UPI001011206C|nr:MULTISPECIES: NAD(P)H-dependent oxidoreductase [unclassified Fusibacter]MCK8058565.1 NAD(P)H-dependent oxidoreductase [Fusibacter sp. A2]NPE22666.1 flavodoxin [Fusibacter sp. A1]RXV60229.1 flavodoxin [Fusibacter sp. A1]